MPAAADGSPSPPTTPDADADAHHHGASNGGSASGERGAPASPNASTSSPATTPPSATAGLSLPAPAPDDALLEDDNSSRVFRTRHMVESAMHLQVQSVTMHGDTRRNSWGIKRRRPSELRSLMKVVERNTREREPPAPNP